MDFSLISGAVHLAHVLTLVGPSGQSACGREDLNSFFFFTCNVDRQRAVGVGTNQFSFEFEVLVVFFFLHVMSTDRGTNQISFEFEVLSILHVMSTGCEVTNQI